jgi:hypothetical protein
MIATTSNSLYKGKGKQLEPRFSEIETAIDVLEYEKSHSVRDTGTPKDNALRSLRGRLNPFCAECRDRTGVSCLASTRTTTVLIPQFGKFTP